MRVVFFVLRKLMDLASTLFMLSLLIFALFFMIPGDPASLLAGVNASTEQVEALRRELSLDLSPPAQYLRWLGGVFRGDFGTSTQYGIPAGPLISDRLIVTAVLSFEAFCLVIIMAFGISLVSARFRGSIFDAFFSRAEVISLSVPHYFWGILLVWVTGFVFHFFSPGGFIHYSRNVWGFASWLLIPSLAVALPNAGMLAKIMRTVLDGELRAAYVRTAESRGCPPSRILLVHALPNTLRPVLTVLGLIAADIFSGSIVVEQVFGIPGIGRLLLSGIARRDFPIVMGVAVYTALVVVLTHFIAELVIRSGDRRYRMGL